MKVIYLIVAMAFSQFVVAQSLYKSSIDAGGASVTNEGLEVIYTIGEIFVSEKKSVSTGLSEGFISDWFTTVVALDDSGFQQRLILYPNPSSSFFAISTDLKIDKLIIYDLHGKEVRVVGKTDGQIMIEALPAGLYTLKFFVGKRFLTKRLVVEK
ncbi:T9SS type A sorting domain-containing protein [Flammeovirgaceae bacterium SG7u.111]|nr:T9SS type A sorting domain-containing protein [Flammeovirgaceae bacterium SG7u.132]WPO38269.1 T9SS type A sorting domain-containing protein [Flammeovirgaceae bacterium SG7u.111]